MQHLPGVLLEAMLTAGALQAKDEL